MKRTTAIFAAAVFAAVVFAESAGVTFTATTANLSAAPEDVRIEILRWSTGEERDRLVAAWNLQGPAAGGGAAKGKGGAGKGKGIGKGAPKGASAGEAPAVTPEAALARALQEAPTVGYLWSSETSGYALRYAARSAAADGSQRVVLLTQRRLGAMNQRWQPANGAPNTYEFSLIELRLNGKDEGEGKVSLIGKLSLDGLEDYAASPVTLANVRKQEPQK